MNVLSTVQDVTSIVITQMEVEYAHVTMDISLVIITEHA